MHEIKGIDQLQLYVDVCALPHHSADECADMRRDERFLSSQRNFEGSGIHPLVSLCNIT